MGVRASATEATGSSGSSFVKGQLEELGWGVTVNAEHDNGTDLILDARDQRRYSLHVYLGAQVKTGTSYFGEPEADDSGTVVGWWFRDSREHFDDWLEHDPSHLVVLHDPAIHVSYWVQVTTEAVVDISDKSAKILVPSDQTVDAAHQQQLIAIAKRRGTVTWEGTAFSGAAVSPTDRLRYALLVPRLIAPHRNAGIPDDLDPESCLAMVVLLRAGELRGGPTEPGRLPDLATAVDRGWRWELAVRLRDYLAEGDVQSLVDLVGRAIDTVDRAAGTVVAAAALIENGRSGEAADLLASALEPDDAGAVDHGWLAVQHARALADTGDLAGAREAVSPAIDLGDGNKADPTAAAIAAAAARVVFTVQDWGAETVQATIKAGDAAAAWWRTHVLSWGLSRQTDQQFTKWVGGEPTGAGYRELRSASLLAGLAGDHGGWRNAVSHIARQQLVLTDRSTDPGQVSMHLDALILAGDEANLKLATRKIVMHGPADAVRRAAHDLDMTRATRTTARTSLTLLAEGGDVVEHADADRHAAWALDTLADTSRWQSQLRPEFLIDHAVLAALRGLTWAVGPTTSRRIIDTIVNLPAQTDQLTAQDWGRLASSLPPSAWTADDTLRAADRAGEHNFELEYSFLELAARHHADVRERLLREAAVGDVQAIAALGEIRDLNEPVVTALVQIAAEHVAEEINRARTHGSYGIGTINWGRLLAALNLIHPQAADWPPLLDLLRERNAHPYQLAPAVQILGRLAHEIPDDVLHDVDDAIRSIPSTPALSPFPTEDLQAATRAFISTVNMLGDSPDRHELHRLLVGTANDRHTAAIIIGRREDPADLPLLDGRPRRRHP